MTADNDLVVALRGAARQLIAHQSIRDRDTLLGQMVSSAVNLVGPAVGGGLTFTYEGDVHSSHATTADVRAVDQLQAELGEGPCISAANDPPPDGILFAHDLAGSDDRARWPDFAPEAVEAGFRSILSVSMVGHGGGVYSALNLYAAGPDAFSADAATIAGLFASHAGVLLYGADTAANLGIALASRDEIGQAKGILMERFKVSNDEAFEMLVRSSQETNMKLVHVARWLTADVEANTITDA